MTQNNEREAFESLFPKPKVFSTFSEQQKLMGQWLDCKRGWETAIAYVNKQNEQQPKQTPDDVNKDAERYMWLKEQVGYVQGATDSVVTIFQDDATYEFIIKIGKNYRSYGRSLNSAIDSAMLNAEKG